MSNPIRSGISPQSMYAIQTLSNARGFNGSIDSLSLRALREDSFVIWNSMYSGYIAPKTLRSFSAKSAAGPPLSTHFNASPASIPSFIPPSSRPLMKPAKYLAIIS
jgi:hypothetical protein